MDPNTEPRAEEPRQHITIQDRIHRGEAALHRAEDAMKRPAVGAAVAGGAVALVAGMFGATEAAVAAVAAYAVYRILKRRHGEEHAPS